MAGVPKTGWVKRAQALAVNAIEEMAEATRRIKAASAASDLQERADTLRGLKFMEEPAAVYSIAAEIAAAAESFTAAAIQMSLAKHEQPVTWWLDVFSGETGIVKGRLHSYCSCDNVAYEMTALLGAVLKWENGKVAILYKYRGALIEIYNRNGNLEFSEEIKPEDQTVDACYKCLYNRLITEGEWWVKE
jgi:hypothetical protein